MTKEEIIAIYIEVSNKLCNGTEWCWAGVGEPLQLFAKLVAEKERAKSLKLWMLLDDVDTADDIAKADDAIYRSLCRQAHKKRWDVLTGDDVDNAIRAREKE